MSTSKKTTITVETSVTASIENVWDKWTLPHHILQWNQASEDWYTPKAENDLRTGGRFVSRMEAKDGSSGFDFEGTYDEVKNHELLRYTMDDGRKVSIQFKDNGETTTVTEIFEAEGTHSIQEQKEGWQAILESFKVYVEGRKDLISLHFEIAIQASPEEVHRIMLEDNSYREWTSEFSPGSHFKGSWEKGTEIRFLGPDQKGEDYGMIGRIKENIPGKIVSIEHYGVLVKGEEITSGKEIEGWAGALESYYFREEGGKTILTVVSDTTKEYEESMKTIWPKALAKLKELCES